MKKIKHIGSYGLIIKDNKIVLIKKVGGPYDGKLDLPGGTIELNETPQQALIRELKEEVGIKVTDYELFDGNSVTIDWIYKGEKQLVHHIGFFYRIINYENMISKNINIDDVNDDSMGAEFYDINKLYKEELSDIAILEIEKLGYKIKHKKEIL